MFFYKSFIKRVDYMACCCLKGAFYVQCLCNLNYYYYNDTYMCMKKYFSFKKTKQTFLFCNKRQQKIINFLIYNFVLLEKLLYKHFMLQTFVFYNIIKLFILSLMRLIIYHTYVYSYYNPRIITLI